MYRKFTDGAEVDPREDEALQLVQEAERLEVPLELSRGESRISHMTGRAILITARIRRMGEGTVFSLFVSSHLGGGGSQVQVWRGGLRSRSGGVPGLRSGGSPSLRSGGSGFGGSYLVSVKGKIFDTRFGLIHVQTGKKIFVEGPPPPVKGKNFDTRFGLIHVQTGKKKFLSRDTPPPSQ